jgi:catalase
VPLADVQPSPALSQVGRTWPTDGRIIGIVTGPDGDLDGVRAARQEVLDGGMVPLVVAPTGGTLGSGADALTVQRTYATARSVEFDALLVAGTPGIGADAYGARDAKAGLPGNGDGAPDPRVGLLLAEAYRHGKAIGAAKGGETALEAAGIPLDAPGVIAGDGATTVLQQLTRLLGSHRVWDRFPATA